MLTSDFKPEVEIWPFRARDVIKNVQYYHYLWPNRRNFRVLEEIGVEEHDGEVRFKTRSGNGRFDRLSLIIASGVYHWATWAMPPLGRRPKM